MSKDKDMTVSEYQQWCREFNVGGMYTRPVEYYNTPWDTKAWKAARIPKRINKEDILSGLLNMIYRLGNR